MTIMHVGRRIMALLQPLTGDRSSGTVTIATTEETASLELAKNTNILPILPSSAPGSTAVAVAHQRPFRLAEAVTVTPDGVDVAVTSLLGGIAHNLPAGTRFRIAPEDNRIASIEASTDLAGATDYTGTGALKQVLMYEQIGGGNAQRDMFLAKLAGRCPAAVLVWESWTAQQRLASNKTKGLDTWSMHVVVSRADAGELRALEGLEILDLVMELVGMVEGVDGETITNGLSSLVNGARVTAADSAYIYAVRFQTSRVITRRDTREFLEWLTTSYTLVTTPPDEALSPSVVTLVDGAVYDHTADEDP